MAKGKPYIFNQPLEQREKSRLQMIERYHAPKTRQRQIATGIKAGWIWLEIGPGAGSSLATIKKLSARQLSHHYLANGLLAKTDINRYNRFTDNPQSWAIYHGIVVVHSKKSFSTNSTN